MSRKPGYPPAPQRPALFARGSAAKKPQGVSRGFFIGQRFDFVSGELCRRGKILEKILRLESPSSDSCSAPCSGRLPQRKHKPQRRARQRHLSTRNSSMKRAEPFAFRNLSSASSLLPQVSRKRSTLSACRIASSETRTSATILPTLRKKPKSAARSIRVSNK